MKLRDVVAVLETIAPTRHAAEWDNVGLIAGDPSHDVIKVLLTVDLTRAVADEAAREACEMIVAYHPPIFPAVKTVNEGSLVFDAIRRGIALYSPHTALDVAEGGTNDALADALGLEMRVPLRVSEPKDAPYKLVFFVPAGAVEKVSAALFEAGAGRIGQYSSCSFRASGKGTFFGEEGANPKVGEKGKLEQVDELRVETVLPLDRVNQALAALRASHPYEEPAFDLVRLAAPPSGVGMGRIGTMKSVARAEVLARLKSALGIDHLLVAGPASGNVTRAAVCAGSSGDIVDDAIGGGAEVYVTGELKHHDALRAAAAGMTVVCTLHSASERVGLRRLKERIEKLAKGLDVRMSAVDRDPFVVA